MAHRHAVSRLRNHGSRFQRIVAGKDLQFPAERSSLQDIEEGLDSRQVGCLLAHYQIVTLAVHRDEVQAERSRGGPSSETYVRIPGDDAIGSREVAVSDPVITVNLLRVHSGLFQEFIQKSTASRTGFAIDKDDIFPCQIIDLSHAFRISGRDHEAFFPARERYDAEVFAGKLFTDKRKIEFPGLGVLQVRTGDMHFALA